MIATVQEVLAINACISTGGGTIDECQSTRTFTDEAEALQGNVCSKNLLEREFNQRGYTLYHQSTTLAFYRYFRLLPYQVRTFSLNLSSLKST